MKIAFVRIMPYPFTIGGGTTHLKDLSRALIEEGHEVHIISAKPEIDNPELLKNERAIVHNIGMRHKKFSGKLWKLPFEAIRRVLFELSFMISSYRLVKKLKPDIIHCQTVLTESFPFALMGRPFIVTEQGAHTKGMKELYSKKKNPISGIGIWLYEQIERFDSRRAGKVICVNEEVKEFYRAKSGTSCEVIGHGTYLNGNGRKIKKKRILFSLSRLSQEKGLDYLIDALTILDKKGLKFEFWIGGDGEKSYVESLKHRAAQLKNIHVKFLGFVVGNAKEKLLNEGSIYVLPSIFEAFGISLVEAMAHRCAVISSNTDGPKRIVKKSFGALVPFADEKKRASNLAAAINKSLRWNIDKMGSAARKEVEKYDYKKIVKKYIQIYRDFIAKYGRK